MRRRTLLTVAAAAGWAAPPASMAPLDYGRSFLTGVAAWNRVRFWVESRTRVIDEATGKFEDYIQCASCKSENTFAERELFHKDNYDFLPIFGPEFGVIFRRKAHVNPNYRSVLPVGQMWEGQRQALRTARRARPLPSPASIREATHKGMPLVAQVEIAGTGSRAIIEFPVKTMNIHDAKDLYQVDTGPVAFPDLAGSGRIADRMWLAFVAFNAPHFADFILEDVATNNTRHYIRQVSLPAKNRLFAVDG